MLWSFGVTIPPLLGTLSRPQWLCVSKALDWAESAACSVPRKELGAVLLLRGDDRPLSLRQSSSA